MRCYGRAAIADLLGDVVIFRGLRPVDRRLPGLPELSSRLGLAPGQRPRKGEAAYARVVSELLRAAQQLAHPGLPISRLVLVGDTLQGDGGAFRGLCAAGEWEGRALICGEEPDAPAALVDEGAGMYTSRRWSGCTLFERRLATEGFAVDQATVVVLDIDKTLLGARGRNHRLIDSARVQALRATVAGLLGPAFDARDFEQAYAAFDQPAYHSFTGDNQDYLAYICLMIGAGTLQLAELQADVQAGRLRSFGDLLAQVGRRPPADPALAALHNEVAALVREGDPTPFKAFRRREYHETAALLGCLPDTTPPEQLLRGEIVITGEVWASAQHWREQGALLVGLSDKPDEASLPAAEDGAARALPLHRLPTHVVGE